MAGTPIGFAAVKAADALGTVFNALGQGAAATTIAIDNTEATIGSAAFDTAMLWLTFAALTAGTGSQYMTAVALPSFDGTDYDPAFVNGLTLYPIENSSTKPINPGASYSVIKIPLYIPPTLFKIALLNNFGFNLPATVTASLYRMRGQAG